MLWWKKKSQNCFSCLLKFSWKQKFLRKLENRDKSESTLKPNKAKICHYFGNFKIFMGINRYLSPFSCIKLYDWASLRCWNLDFKKLSWKFSGCFLVKGMKITSLGGIIQLERNLSNHDFYQKSPLIMIFEVSKSPSARVLSYRQH
jgi:hypothetical protein